MCVYVCMYECVCERECVYVCARVRVCVYVCVKEVYLCGWVGACERVRGVCFSVCVCVLSRARVYAKKQLARNARTDAVEQPFKHRILYNADRPLAEM